MWVRRHNFTNKIKHFIHVSNTLFFYKPTNSKILTVVNAVSSSTSLTLLSLLMVFEHDRFSVDMELSWSINGSSFISTLVSNIISSYEFNVPEIKII